MNFADFFRHATGHGPYGYQCRLACGDTADSDKPETLTAGTGCNSRLVSIPTGLGKTAAVILAWLWNRVILGDDTWPRRLVYCLPMRVLVEQINDEVEKWLKNLAASCEDGPVKKDLLWLCEHSPVILMGGEENDPARREWDIHPEKPAILIGTQDMLLSRALNRGYGMSRARWPMHFGLLNNDALWVMDETQLMDAGLATSAQLQSFRDEDREKTPFPCSTWWMSATLQAKWLESPETHQMLSRLTDSLLSVCSKDRQGPLWNSIQKTLVLKDALDEKKLAAFTGEICTTATTTLVIVNTVKRAQAVFAALEKNKQLAAFDIYLVHSRFRPCERAAWRNTFLRKDASIHRPRIIVSTQVSEAGVDISADLLVTDLAPWTSLVQRFGRAARYGGSARVFVVDVEEKKAAPYDAAELEAARAELNNLADVAIASIETHEAMLSPERKEALYPYAPAFLLLRRELDELFDTSADLSGADIDIARFIRSGEENDCQIAWLPLGKDEEPSADSQPGREALCSVSIGEMRKYVQINKGAVWKWDYLDRRWEKIASERDIYPGLILLTRADTGGYSVRLGFDLSVKEPVPCEEAGKPSKDSAADSAHDDESLSKSNAWQSIAEHGAQVAEFLNSFKLVPSKLASIFDAAGRWHDLGKAHSAFCSIHEPNAAFPDGDIAKAPENAWFKPARYRDMDGRLRPGFRHELASMLALLDVLHQHAPRHEALLGPWGDFFAEYARGVPTELPAHSVQHYVSRLSENDFNLLLYLVLTHHGKIRVRLHATPGDQDYCVASPGDDMPICGVLEGDTIPSILLTLPDTTSSLIPKTTLTLAPATLGLSEQTGASWSERCNALLALHGPFALAWFETLVRAADALASK